MILSSFDLCLASIQEVTQNSSLAFATNRENLYLACRKLKEGVVCADNHMKNCTNRSQKNLFEEIVNGTKQVLNLLCKTGDFQNKTSFASLIKILKNCTNRSQKNLFEEIVNGTKQVLNLLCKTGDFQNNYLRYAQCFKNVSMSDQNAFQESVECQIDFVRRDCGQKAVDFFETYLKQISSSLMHQHCISYTYSGSCKPRIDSLIKDDELWLKNCFLLFIAITNECALRYPLESNLFDNYCSSLGTSELNKCTPIQTMLSICWSCDSTPKKCSQHYTSGHLLKLSSLSLSSRSDTRGRTRARISLGASNVLRLEVIESVRVAVLALGMAAIAPTSSVSAAGILNGISGSSDWCCFSRLIRRRHLSSHDLIVAFATSSSIKNSSSSRAISNVLSVVHLPFKSLNTNLTLEMGIIPLWDKSTKFQSRPRVQYGGESIASCIILFQSSPVTIRNSVMTPLGAVRKLACLEMFSPNLTAPKSITPAKA
ncbi:unnamed protein product [Medioppia subpectinata]|uniref:Uncharacterized protein n=1 Tax=Medioppia subpectinata TaxID=1979941 RepID=A0A7R9KWE7_9ACAR|nr:unnamed protein product [Medioppia subpectinata]CAG2110768.1 unnamed protein product [Medioppia subpectinata]